MLDRPNVASPDANGVTRSAVITLVRSTSLVGAGDVNVVEVAAATDPLGATSLRAPVCALEAIDGVAGRTTRAAGLSMKPSGVARC